MKIKYFIGGKNIKRKPLTLKRHDSGPLGMASLTRWTWGWVGSGRWQWAGTPGVLPSMGSQRAGHDWTDGGKGAPRWRRGKESACQCKWRKSPRFDPGSGRPLGEEKDHPLQYSCLENPMDRGAWRATVHGVAKSQTRPSDFTHFTHSLKELEMI